MMVLELALLIVAFILLVIAAGSWVDAGRWSLGWLGVAFYVLSVLVPKFLPQL